MVVDWHYSQNKILEVYKLFLEKVRGAKLIFQINSILTNLFFGNFLITKNPFLITIGFRVIWIENKNCMIYLNKYLR